MGVKRSKEIVNATWKWSGESVPSVVVKRSFKSSPPFTEVMSRLHGAKISFITTGSISRKALLGKYGIE